MYFGSVCHGALPQMVRPTAGRNQDLTKHLLPLHLLPAFTDMDHVHKVLVGPGFSPGSGSGLGSSPGLSSGLKRKHSSCGVCRLRFNSEAQASSHYSGTKHAKRMKALDTPDSKIKTPEPVAKDTASQILALSPSSTHPSSSSDNTSGEPSSPVPSPSSGGSPDPAPPSCAGPKDLDAQTNPEVDTAPDDETEEERAIRLLYCSLCKVAVNSASQLQAHNSGTKHKTMLEARSGDGAIKSFPRSGVKSKVAAAVAAESSTGLQNKTFHCEICDVHVNSETQLKQHISSRRHKDRAAGKPAKPKFSPYSPNQRNQHSFQTIRLALRKNQDLTKPLASCLLQRQISVAAAAMATLPPFPLRPAANSNFFQTQTLPQSILPPPPAPGTICSTHGPLLFAPY